MPGSKVHISHAGFTSSNHVKLFKAGQQYFDALNNMIKNAKHNIYLQLYIFEEDSTGESVAQSLLDAVKRGVIVRLLVDAYGSYELSGHFRRRLKEGGIQFRLFQPLFKTRHFYIGRRLHEKLLVADDYYCMIGGINIGDRYNDTTAGRAWLDFAVYAEGEIATKAGMLARQAWSALANPLKYKVITPAATKIFAQFTERVDARLTRNDWIYGKNEISNSYQQIFSAAKSHITIVCSYFIPGKTVRRHIKAMLKRKVKVRVILEGRSDVALAKYAERFMYAWLLRNGVEIYEYQPTVLHAKLAVCDNCIVTVGSYNINNISAYASVELNVEINNRKFAAGVEKLIDDVVLPDCIRITSNHQHQVKSVYKKFAWWLSYQFMRLLFFLFTFYVKQQKSSRQV